MQKNPLERIQIIDLILRNKDQFTSLELLHILKTEYALNITVRTLITDINYLRSKGAPIPHRAKKYFYTNAFELNNAIDYVAHQNNKASLEILNRLKTFTKINQVLGENEIFNDQDQKFVYFDMAIENTDGNEHIPVLLSHIQSDHVLKIKFVDFNKKTFDDIFHPYILKEYNGRWFVMGLNERQMELTGKKSIFIYALDRIRKIEHIRNPLMRFPNVWWDADMHFKHMVGVTNINSQKPENIIVRIYGLSAEYVLTKKIHSSQAAISEEDDYVDFKYFVVNNYEFRSKIFALGENAEVLEPKALRAFFAAVSEQMGERYLE